MAVLSSDVSPCTYIQAAGVDGLKITNGYVGFEVLPPVVMKSTVFCDIMPCSLLKFKRRFGGKCKMEAICSSETSVDCQRTSQRYIPEDRSLQIITI
jgi:hypothetical protein